MFKSLAHTTLFLKILTNNDGENVICCQNQLIFFSCRRLKNTAVSTAAGFSRCHQAVSWSNLIQQLIYILVYFLPGP